MKINGAFLLLHLCNVLVILIYPSMYDLNFLSPLFYNPVWIILGCRSEVQMMGPWKSPLQYVARISKFRILLTLHIFFNFMFTFLCDKSNDAGWYVLQYSGRSLEGKLLLFFTVGKIATSEWSKLSSSIDQMVKSCTPTRLDSTGLASRWRRWCCSQTSWELCQFSAVDCAMQ